MDLFDCFEEKTTKLKPLAERMRAANLDEFVGQDHIVGEGGLLRRAISIDRLGSCIFYGPPGTGKTTLAKIISHMTASRAETMNAVLSGVPDARKIIDEAEQNFRMTGQKTYLILDECHRWNKAQSDCLLAPIEQGYIVLIGTTTENPYANMTKAVLSRCRMFHFHQLKAPEILIALKRSIMDSRGLAGYRIKVGEGALEHIADFSNGDLRSAYNALELAVITTRPEEDGYIHLTKEVAQQSIETKDYSLDESTFYDMLSAFCKSLRGSDADGAIYWSKRMLKGGIDPLVICRRLIAHSAEDVGMADPHAQLMAVSAMTAMEKLGMPEGEIPLTAAIIYVCEAPKSNSVVVAIGRADELVTKTAGENVPAHLVNAPYRDDFQGTYKYPHSYGGWVEQDYLPKVIRGEKIYMPSDNGFERGLFRAKVQKKPKK